MEDDSELHARSSARLGSTLRGKYRLERILGIGGMAVVYAVTHRNQKQFAVKMLHAELSMREDIRTRFLREGYAANSLKHSGAVAVLDDDVAEDGAAFLVMELLEGGGVEELWESFGQRLPLRATLALAHQLLDVLGAAHSKGIIHRDIKPANLFLTEDGTVKVLDFGIARVRDLVAGNSQATGTGMLLGTPAFMAPEQALAKSNEMDGQTDVWAVGATLFTLLSGQLVHEGDNASQLMVKTATAPARSLAVVAPDVPAPVVQLVDVALAFDKPARWASAHAMRDAVRDTYLGVFGEAISRAPLLSLFQDRSAIGVQAEGAPGAVVSSAVPRTTPSPGVALHPSATGPVAPLAQTTPSPRAFGGTMRLPATPDLFVPARATASNPGTGLSTSKPVSSEVSYAPAGAGASKGRTLLLPVLAGIGIGVVAGGLVLWRSLSHGGAVASAAPAPSAQSAPSSGPAPAPAVPSASAVPIASTTAPPATFASTPAPPTSTALAPSTVTAPTSKPSPRPAPTAKRAAANCNPNYVLDANGEQHFKPECFK
jgi:serine/threonine-protein kinase